MAVDLQRPVNISDKSMPEPTKGGTPKGEVESLSIEKAANGGYSVQCRYKPKKSKKNEVSYESPETHVFEDGAAMTAFVESAFGISGGDEAADEGDDE